MTNRRLSKGKKRAVQDLLSEEEPLSEASSSMTLATPLSTRAQEKQPAVPAKKSKRAETRKCPVCNESIPIRLLGKHAVWESERLEEIVRCIGSTEVHEEADPDDGSARTRRSALKARQHLRPGSSSKSVPVLDQTTKTLRLLKRHRRQRCAKLRELTREDEDGMWWGGRRHVDAASGEGLKCPVCAKFIAGDGDIIEAHVDSCLANLRLRDEQDDEGRRARRTSVDVGVDGDVDIDGDGGDGIVDVMDGISFQGTGFDRRNRNDQDVDDDIDIDGEDEVIFGAAQFTERDVLVPSILLSEDQSDAGTDADVDVEDAGASGSTSTSVPERDLEKGTTLRDLVVKGKVVNEAIGLEGTETFNLAIELAHRSGDQAALMRALESKVRLLVSAKVSSSSTALLCRICLDPYTEPTVSTGCWHTCCRECWLRCLGSTKLCPICKRITGAVDLRRVYL